MKYNKILVEDCRVFYREAGNPENPTLLLLHGFPSSSHMFRELMPELADEYHLIAPDFPAFGQTESPDREHFTYSFDHLARIVDKFTEAIGLNKFAMYVFDYGAPIGYRLAMWHPERITAIISQNGNMYDEGLGKKWEARKAYWQNRGENDPSFIPAGANAFKRDLPNAEIHFVPSGHFALESHHTKIAQLMREFLVGVVQ